jgi:hypothetical protein
MKYISLAAGKENLPGRIIGNTKEVIQKVLRKNDANYYWTAFSKNVFPAI